MARGKRSPAKSAREREIEAEIAEVARIAAGAEQARSWQAAVAARTKLHELRTDLHRARALRLLDAEEDALRRTRGLRRIAEAEGQWTALSNLAKLEAEQAEAVAEAERRKAEAELAHLSREEVLAVVSSLLDKLPIEDVSAIGTAIGHRLGDDVHVVGFHVESDDDDVIEGDDEEDDE